MELKQEDIKLFREYASQRYKRKVKTGKAQLSVRSALEFSIYELRVTARAADMLEAIQPFKLKVNNENHSLSLMKGGDLKVVRRKNYICCLKGGVPARVNVEIISKYGTVFELQQEGDIIELKSIEKKVLKPL